VGGRLNKEMREVAICGEGDVHARRPGKDWVDQPHRVLVHDV
jgi:hypothetical protein